MGVVGQVLGIQQSEANDKIWPCVLVAEDVHRDLVHYRATIRTMQKVRALFERKICGALRVYERDVAFYVRTGRLCRNHRRHATKRKNATAPVASFAMTKQKTLPFKSKAPKRHCVALHHQQQ